MDYTTLARVKAMMNAIETTQDTLLAQLITAVSRIIDRKCTGVDDPDAVDYFKSETKTGELLTGQIDNKGNVICCPHKPTVDSVASFEYRLRPIDSWVTIGTDRLWINGIRVEAYPDTASYRSTRCQVRITYTGGLATTVENLPADLLDAASLLAIRLYKESESGLNDAVGIAELATMVYTKAFPTRFLEMIQPYKRVAGWRFIA